MENPPPQEKKLPRSTTAWAVVIALVIGLGGFGAGWIVKGFSSVIAPPQSLRLNGYQFIDPLLACNINNSNVFQEDQSLNKQIQSIIDAHKNSGDISKASVYFLNLANGKWSGVYDTEAYYPSSLGKIPIMIAYYQLAEESPGILNQEVTYPVGSTDLNQMQDIIPPEVIVPGQTYTVEQLIEYMIKYSDNNATQLLYSHINQNSLSKVYGDLGIPVNSDATLANLDFITPHQISTLFRILYNATYLSRDDSEKALQLLSQTSFTQGIVASVASSTVVSHKLGLVEIAPNDILTEHELHDCGIVYTKTPYLLCIMTRGSASLPTLEGIIAQISGIVYSNVQKGG